MINTVMMYLGWTLFLGMTIPVAINVLGTSISAIAIALINAYTTVFGDIRRSLR